MLAQAPGKIVLSGAYSVFEGAPAIVTAVNRYVVADATRPATFVTPELAAALESCPYETAPWFDASALRRENQKLGLGSSAAIVTACLAAIELRNSGFLKDPDLRDAVFSSALEAHQRAQGGGSGIDVASAAYGGTITALSTDQGLEINPVDIPSDLHIGVWFSGKPASTQNLLRCVRSLYESDPQAASRLIAAQALAAEGAARAFRLGDTPGFIAFTSRQRECLDALGIAADCTIVTPETRELDYLARREGGAVLPSGAGGGDIAIFVGKAPPSLGLLAAAAERDHIWIDGITLGARGVHAFSEQVLTTT